MTGTARRRASTDPSTTGRPTSITPTRRTTRGRLRSGASCARGAARSRTPTATAGCGHRSPPSSCARSPTTPSASPAARWLSARRRSTRRRASVALHRSPAIRRSTVWPAACCSHRSHRSRSSRGSRRSASCAASASTTWARSCRARRSSTPPSSTPNTSPSTSSPACSGYRWRMTTSSGGSCTTRWRA